jgi:2-C-methyl-D-erythritol 2,4-cyclodiphosphate synthase
MMSHPSGKGSREYRSGIGYDIHPLIGGRKLFLGGVEIPFDKGLSGHSDADVLLHAVADALLGAAGRGDIGEHFPDTDRQYKGIASLQLLKMVRQELGKAGWEPLNVDCVLLAEAPKIGPYKGQMKALIAGALNIPPERVNVKATTNEGLGFVGRREGMAAYATALVRSAQQG